MTAHHTEYPKPVLTGKERFESDTRAQHYGHWVPLSNEWRNKINRAVCECDKLYGDIYDYCSDVGAILLVIHRANRTMEVVYTNEEKYARVGNARVNLPDLHRRDEYDQMIATHLCVAYLTSRNKSWKA